MYRFLRLGASLYVPSTHPDLVVIGNRQKYPHLRSVIFCTEDAIRSEEVELGLKHLENALRRFEPVELLRFIRVRNPAVLRILLQMQDIHHLDGFVLPKLTCANVDAYFDAFAPHDAFAVMPTLETLEVFDVTQMVALRNLLLQECYRRRILTLRIGGNDLFKLLGLRRPRSRTIYDTPLRSVIAQLVTTFRPHGFNLTAPVFEYLQRPKALAREVTMDLAYGLFGKTAIHPEQVAVIEAGYRVNPKDYRVAERILEQEAPAVFRYDDAMCELATHHVWATLIHERARLYGLSGQTD